MYNNFILFTKSLVPTFISTEFTESSVLVSIEHIKNNWFTKKYSFLIFATLSIATMLVK